MNTKSVFFCLALAGWLAARAEASTPPEFASWIKTIHTVRPEGGGNPEAARAWQQLSKLDASSLPDLLAAMNGANDLALNWLRAAVDAVAGRAPAGQLPVPALNKFLADTAHHVRARRLAYELIARADSEAAKKLLPTFLNDPSNELRREAVQQLIDQASQTLGGGRTNEASVGFQKALTHARDIDQIESLAKQLRDLGQPVNFQKTFGWLTRWKLIGPFDNAGGAGFEAVYPPEHGIDLATEYDGKSSKVRWVDYETNDDYGMVNFNKPFTALKGVAGYAYTEFHSDAAKPVELRLGGKNSWKVWVNGKFLFGRDEYHRGAEIDQYRIRAELKPGKNTILVKCCQNEQKEDWTVEWQFQLRITDAQGTPIASAK